MGIESTSFHGFVNDELLWNVFMLTMHILLPNRILETLGQFENLMFVIMSTRENTRLIARTPFDLLSPI